MVHAHQAYRKKTNEAALKAAVKSKPAPKRTGKKK
jgi:hypothetical protein